ncbi:MAG: hypothetical protein WA005_16035 [Candidatus Binataceae bacterium]
MLIVEKSNFALGAVMAVTFWGVVILMFSPLFGGLNAFQTFDRLFNSMAKGSCDYYGNLHREAAQHRGSDFAVAIELESGDRAVTARALLHKAGVRVDGNSVRVKVSGDLGELAEAIIDDSEAMFRNSGKASAVGDERPGEREILFVWWNILKDMQKAFALKEKFKEAAFLNNVTTRGVEVAYNFYGIEPRRASKSAGVLAASLFFYILCTLWWGYAIFSLFHGLGMEMKASTKKEV